MGNDRPDRPVGVRRPRAVGVLADDFEAQHGILVTVARRDRGDRPGGRFDEHRAARRRPHDQAVGESHVAQVDVREQRAGAIPIDDLRASDGSRRTAASASASLASSPRRHAGPGGKRPMNSVFARGMCSGAH